MEYRCFVIFSPFADKQVRRLPFHIQEKVLVWAKNVEQEGIFQIRKRRGYHDEPLSGKREGQRSVRLSRSYRLIYEENLEGEIIILAVKEVHKHEY